MGLCPPQAERDPLRQPRHPLKASIFAFLGSVALRPQLSLGLPLSVVKELCVIKLSRRSYSVKERGSALQERKYNFL